MRKITFLFLLLFACVFAQAATQFSSRTDFRDDHPFL